MEREGGICERSEANPVRQQGHSSWQLAGAQLALAVWPIYQQAEGGRVEVHPETGSLCCQEANNNQGEMCKIVVKMPTADACGEKLIEEFGCRSHHKTFGATTQVLRLKN